MTTMTMQRVRKKRSHHHHVNRRKFIGLVIGLLLLLGGCAIGLDYTFRRISLNVQTFVSELGQTVTIMESVSQNPNGAMISQAQTHLLNARAIFDSFRPLVEWVKPVTKIIPLTNLQQVVAWWTFSDQAMLAGQELLNGAKVVVLALQDNHLPGLLTKTAQLQTSLKLAENHFQQAQTARNQIDTQAVPFFLPAEYILPNLARWDTLTAALSQTLAPLPQLVTILPTMLGQEQPKTYLVIIQSSDNLRATGGFLTGIGTIRWENGRVTNVTMRDVTEREFAAEWTPSQGFQGTRVLPPNPIRRYMGLGHWVLRDGNWWADFPTTARQVNQFWQLAGGDADIDGVMGLTDEGIATLLESAGAITLPDGQTLTAQNFKAIISQRIYNQNKISKINQESVFFQQVAQALLAYTEHQSTAQWLSLARRLPLAMQRHDIMFASFDPQIASMFYNLNFDGAVRGQQDDYVYLVEDNLCDSKLNSLVKQSLRYEVELTPTGQPSLAVLTIDKINGYQSGMSLAYFPANYNLGGRWDASTRQWNQWAGYYGGYLRLFPALNSQLGEAIGFDESEVIKESDRAIFGGYVGLWESAQRQLQYRWIPGGQPSAPGQYKLLVQRQPGALAHPLTVVVHLPAQMQAVNISPPPTNFTEQTVTWQTVLDEDLIFKLELK